METLQSKMKRLEFLKELKERDLTIPVGQIERTERAIAFMRLAIRLEEIKAKRNAKIDQVLKYSLG